MAQVQCHDGRTTDRRNHVTNYKAGSVDDFPAGTLQRIQVGGVSICLVRGNNGTFHALRDSCSHEGYPLSDGDVVGDTVECPAHGSRFDLASGAALGLPAVTSVPIYPVHVADSVVWVSV
jgi:3-phenylpropionate/trans-cinnamate dioxygenase ferredoxin component